MYRVDLGDAELTARFNDKITRDPDTGCLMWTAARNSAGYGVFCIGGGRLGLARRIAYEAHVGEIPTGRTLHGKCSRACVNPEHMRIRAAA